MDPIRSSGTNKPVLPAPANDEEFDEELEFFRSVGPSELEAEESRLPEPAETFTYPEDEYDEMAWVHRVPYEFDDRSAWEQVAKPICATCGIADDVDPLGTCWDCRLRDHRCQWCGLDKLIYTDQGSCRTCYQRIRRTRVTNEEALRISMMEAAFRRSDLRKRRNKGR